MAYSVIIPSRNIDNLLACVGALRAAGETARVIVVWDHGKPAPPGVQCRAIPATGDQHLEVYEGVSPFCFARNCNIGIAAAGTDDVVLLNDDALLESGSHFEDLRPSDGYGTVDATTNVTGYPEQWRRRFDAAQLCREVQLCAFVCVYIPRRTLDIVGLLDERFCGPGVYGGEDVDYCLRVQQAGLKVGVSDLCFVDHASLKSTFRGAHPTNGAPGDIRESSRIGREKWGDKWPRLGGITGAPKLAPPNRINVYTCSKCGGYTVTIDIHEGVTPFMLCCRASGREGDCRGMAESSLYPSGEKPSWIPDPAWEWFKPVGPEYRKLNRAMREHVDKGGLDIRPRLRCADRGIMANLTLVYVAKDQVGLDAFDLTHMTGAEVIGWANDAGLALSRIGNEMLDRCKSLVFGLCHADAVFGPGALDAFVAEAMRGAVCGIVGIDLAGLYRCSFESRRDSWWQGEGAGRGWAHENENGLVHSRPRWPPSRILTGGPGEVSTLDGMAVFFRRDLGLRFDEETFTGYHCHVEDLCLQAHSRGIPVTVPAADAHHRNHIQSQAFLADYRRYRAKLAAKWAGTEVRTT
jgi:GT2 family glycosyltransferase